MAEALLALLLTGGIGYAIGRAPFQQWEAYINAYNKRMGRLAYDKVINPYAFYEKVTNGKKLHVEALLAYLVGLPNASLPVMMRCLEIGLREHYRLIEKKEPSLTLFKLTEWAEQSLGRRKELAHGFRILRNLIHEEKIVEEQDTLEAIRHVTNMLNVVFPFDKATLPVTCSFCNSQYKPIVQMNDCYFGNTIVVQCNNCKRSISLNVLP